METSVDVFYGISAALLMSSFVIFYSDWFWRKQTPASEIWMSYHWNIRGATRERMGNAARISIHDRKNGQSGILRIRHNRTQYAHMRRRRNGSEELFHSFVKHLPSAVFLFDMRGYVTMVNTTAARILGYTEKELIGYSLTKLLVRGDAHKVLKHVEQTLSGKQEERTYRCLAKLGSQVEICVVLIPVSIERREMGMYAIVKDVTAGKQSQCEYDCLLKEQNRLQRQLEELNRRYQLIFDTVGEGICLTDATGIIISCNPAMLRMAGYEMDDMIGQSFHDLLHYQKSNRKRGTIQDCPFFKAVRTGKAYRSPYEVFWRKDGTSFLLEYVMTPIIEDGISLGTILIIQDVTIRRETEEILLKSAKLSIVGQLAAGVAHEIRNPLTALKGFTQLLSEENHTKQMYFSIMQSELERIEQIVNEFLILAKPHKVSFQPRDLTVCINSVIDLLKAQAVLHNIQIRLETDERLPLVECDDNRLKQVFINLLKNAIEAMTAGGEILIEAGSTSGTNHGQDAEVFVRISDEGEGIRHEILQNIGEPFYSTKEKGTGLGLMVSHKIIESHKGTMHIESEVGKGTTVEIRLPFCHPGEHETDLHLLEQAFLPRFHGKHQLR